MSKVTYYGDVERRRGLASPSVQQQLDALWKALQELRLGSTGPGFSFSPDVQNMIERIAAVQAQYPYPPAGDT